MKNKKKRRMKDMQRRSEEYGSGGGMANLEFRESGVDLVSLWRIHIWWREKASPHE